MRPRILRALPLRRAASFGAGLALAAAALLGTAGPGVVDGADLRPAFAPGCLGYCKHPTNAGKVFRWGREDWRQEFEVGKLGKNWKSDHPGLVTQRFGMLTINAEPKSDHITVWANDQSAKYGRWEARVRAGEKTKGAGTFRFTWELAPTSGAGCDARKVVLAKYRPGDTRAVGAVRAGKGRQFTFSVKRDLRSWAWHTYAVEITKDHVSWFVDTKVIRTERRPAALTGITYRPQFEVDAPSRKNMNYSRMQMDWVRYYTLKRPNAKPIKAPGMTPGKFRGGC